ncbi:glycosyltransferase family 2 protein [Marinoscillum sp.]|uniref:glycosyltransferase family 2 protein n=1 Tax=Marinoscillum sp. TaxID=2024838 RepID=UPI003BA8E5AA
MKKVSIITVNYNQPEVTLELLKSLREQDYQNLEVIVVDNGSREDASARINEEYPETITIRSEKNLGFAGGNNLGIRASTGDCLFFLNNDTVVPKGTIASLVDVLHREEETGVVCPVINYFDHPKVTQFAGYTPINTITGRNHAVGYMKQIPVDRLLMESPFAHGAAMMLRRSVVDQVGLMPENYFLYYEELDWGAKITKAGFKIKVDRSVRIFHKESISTGKASPLKTYFQTRNRILFMRRNVRGLRKIAFLLFFTFLAFPKSLLGFLMKREMDHFYSFWNGAIWNLFNSTDSLKLGYKYDQLKG